MRLGPVQLAGAALVQVPATVAEEDRRAVVEAVGELVGVLEAARFALEEDVILARADATQAEVPFLGPSLSRAEIYGQIRFAARRLEKVAASVLEGYLSVYVTPEQRRRLESLKVALAGVAARAEGAGAVSLERGHEGAAEDYVAARVVDVEDLRDAAEMLVVMAENGAVPVREPGERLVAAHRDILVGVGALAAGALLLYLFS